MKQIEMYALSFFFGLIFSIGLGLGLTVSKYYNFNKAIDKCYAEWCIESVSNAYDMPGANNKYLK